MKRRLLFFVSFIQISVIIFAQQVVNSKGTAQEELTRDKSRAEVEKKVREMASIDALERAFGRVIIQGNSTFISNLQTGQKVETNTVFNTIANTSVKGEIIEVLKEKFTDIQGVRVVEGVKVNVTDIKCDIGIKAREIVAPPVEFNAFPMSCLDEKCKTTSFKNNDRLYFFFTSPMSGYITIYLTDMDSTFCLYPYRTMPAEFEGGVPVAADKKYFLFSDRPEYNYFPGKEFIYDDYALYSKTQQDINRIYVIFSKTPLNKPSMKNVSNSQSDNKKITILPKMLPSEDFQRWLNNYRSSAKSDVQVSIIDVTITR